MFVARSFIICVSAAVNRRESKKKLADLMSRARVGRGLGRLTALRAVVVSWCLAAAAMSSGCTSVISYAASGMADNLSTAIMDQQDPELVREGVPTFLLLLDSVIISAPEDPKVLGAAAELYAAYGVAFVSDPGRAGTLTARARELGERALCADNSDTCDLRRYPFDEYERAIRGLGPKSINALYSYSIGSLAYIRAHSGDWVALADLPKIEVALEHLLALDPGEKAGSINMYLGILNTLRPPALGGEPELGQQYFEKAVELTDGKDLSVKVEYAQGYARLVYNRELHDQLLNDVLGSEVKQPGLTLTNSLAQRQAAELLATAEEYF
jgi:hypothetical protein